MDRRRALGVTAAVMAALWVARRAQVWSRRMRMRGRVVLVTGGSRGLGLLLAEQYLRRGAKVAICGRDRESLDRAFRMLQPHGTVLAVRCELTDPSSIGQMLESVRKTLGPIDVLVNNAGVIAVGPVQEMSEEDFALATAVHHDAPRRCIEGVLPDMRARGGGRIVNISSIGGRVAVPHLMPYVSSKFALTGLSRAYRVELQHEGIYVTSVFPGLIRTGSPRNALFKGRSQQEFAWFDLAAAMPLLSVSARAAARRIVRASIRGQAELVIGLPARLAITAHDLAPGLVYEVLGVIDRLLPAPGGNGRRAVPGRQTRRPGPRWLTALDRRAARAHNQTFQEGETDAAP